MARRQQIVEGVAGKLVINKAGLVENPVYPCCKGDGLCQLRTRDTDRFKCVFKAKACRYRRIGEVEEVKPPDEMADFWDKLESAAK